MTEFKTQAKREDYFGRNYDTVERFISYYYQSYCVLQFKNIKKVLEVGIGNMTLTNYLRQHDLDVTTCDYGIDLKPDYVADIRNLPMGNNEFDASLAFEILEHIPFSDFEKGLNQLARVSRNYVIISVPNSTSYVEFKMKYSFPKLRRKKLYWKLQIPDFLTTQGEGNHYWELNRRGYPVNRIRNSIKKCGLEIIKEFEPELHNHHHFFIMKKIRET